MSRNISLPQSGEYGTFYQGYIEKVNGNPIELLANQLDIYTKYIQAHADRLDYRYAEGKWSIRESLIHIIDTEQIFAYRALRISRGDTTPLAGFNQDEYIENNNFDHWTAADLIEGFTTQRKLTLAMVAKFTDEQLLRMGVASNAHTSVRALIYIIAGHAQHHIHLFNERYR